jgi:hypothetical protein
MEDDLCIRNRLGDIEALVSAGELESCATQVALLTAEQISIERLTTAVGKASEDAAKSARRHVTAVATELDDKIVSMQADLHTRLATLEADCVGPRESPVTIDQRVIIQSDREAAVSQSTLVGDKFLVGDQLLVESKYLSFVRSWNLEEGETGAANPETETHGIRISSDGFLPAREGPAGAAAGAGGVPFSAASGGVALPYITDPEEFLRKSAAAAALVAQQ